MPYTCNICVKEFTTQQNLTYHKEHNSCKIANFECKYCKKTFTAYPNMYRHVKTACKEKKKADDDRENILDRLVKLEEKNKLLEQDHSEIEKIKKENRKLKAQLKKVVKLTPNPNNINTGNINNINNGTINNNLNVILVGYGKEDMSKINKDDMLKILQHGYDSTLHLTNRVHFNPELPEYNNIYISNMKDKFAMMFDGKDWILTMKEDLIQKIYDDKRSYIETNLDDFINSLTKERQKALKRWLDTDEDHPRIKKIKDDITLMLYNKRKIATDKTLKITDKINIQNESDNESDSNKSNSNKSNSNKSNSNKSIKHSKESKKSSKPIKKLK